PKNLREEDCSALTRPYKSPVPEVRNRWYDASPLASKLASARYIPPSRLSTSQIFNLQLKRKNDLEGSFLRGGVHAFSAKFIGVFQGLFYDFRLGDFEACGSDVFDVQTGARWNTVPWQSETNKTINTGYLPGADWCIRTER
ncbi:MAG: hypothetical protein NUV54_01465, partial [Candidatus Taylorbacteria bacterium]|nr:hypothetical protein [Candidatus Taylorbacteria bacterium]